jgi:glycosyltransferase involved in cell wall biosynthesis
MTSRLVIAHVLSSFGQGGQERVAVDLARLQRAAGHDVIGISIAPEPEGPIAGALRAAGITSQTVAKRGRGVDPWLPARLAGLLRRVHVDVVHTHNPHALIYGAPAARLAGAAAIHSKHGLNPDRRRRLWLRRAAATLVDAYVAVTPLLAARAVADGDCASSRLRVISNGIDIERFERTSAARYEVRAELGIPRSAWVVGTVGRLAPEKDQAFLIDALGPLLREDRRLVIVGDGLEREALRAQVARSPGGRFVHLLGSRDDVQRTLASFDAFALTSRTEGLPLVLLEAMAAGLPVVSTAVGGVPDLVDHGVTGLLCPRGDHVELARLVASLASDAALCERLGAAGRARVVARHSMEHMARQYDVLYRRTLRARGGVQSSTERCSREPASRAFADSPP